MKQEGVTYRRNKEAKEEGGGRSEHKSRTEQMDVKRTCGEKTEQSKKEGAGRKKN
jgi:hypothetical protein